MFGAFNSFGRMGGRALPSPAPAPAPEPVGFNTSVTVAANSILSDSNRVVSMSGVTAVLGPVPHATGKHYFEIKVESEPESQQTPYVGVCEGISGWSGFYSNAVHKWMFYDYAGGMLDSNVSGASIGSGAWGISPTTGDVIQIAIDSDAGIFLLGMNGTWKDPQTLAGLAGASVYPMVAAPSSGGSQIVYRGRFVAADLEFAPPSGYSAWA